MPKQRMYVRVVGKQGYIDKSGKAFEKLVREWQQKAKTLKSLGYVIEYSIPDPTGQYRDMLRITYSDGHSEIMTRDEAFNLKS